MESQSSNDTRKVVIVGGTSGSLLSYTTMTQEIADLVLARLKAEQPVTTTPLPPDVEDHTTIGDTPWVEDSDSPATDQATSKPAMPGDLIAVSPVSAMSEKPWGYNRLQVPHKSYRDGFQVKAAEVALKNAPGFPDETPALLGQHGWNQFDARQFYGDGARAPWGLPTKDMVLFYEITGGDLEPYRSPFDVLTTPLEVLGANLFTRLPQWNTSEGNGLINGVATVKQAHINAEYEWFEQYVWDRLNPVQRLTPFYNYVTGKTETLLACYGRGIDAMKEALHQKWRNYLGLVILINNFRSPGIKTYYGDHSGIAPIYSIKDVAKPTNTQAEEICNAGKVVVNGQSFDVSGNLRGMAGIAHCYNYENYVTMSVADYRDFQATTNHDHPVRDIRYWQDKMKPDLSRPYDLVQYCQEVLATMQRKGWPDFQTYWQTEPNYEQGIMLPERNWELVAGFVSWAPNCKIPLHPEIAGWLVIIARFHLQGFYPWGKNWRQDLPAGISENSHPELHNTGREGFQVALDTLSTVDAFGPSKRILTGSIPILNPAANKYVSGDAASLLLANGDSSKPIPLVIGVYDPDTRTECYGLYYPNQDRQQGSTSVRFKSPIDGTKHTSTANGWGITLYTRENVTETTQN